MLFKNIVGQQEVKQRLIQSVKDQRISHAQLFLGPEGSGALALAIAYARFIACKDPGDNDACGVCSSCVKMDKLSYPDLHFVYPVALSSKVRTSADVLPQWREAVLENPYLGLNDWFDYLDAENKQPVIAAEESGEIVRKLSLTTYEGGYKIMIIWMAEKMNVTAANKLLKILEEPPDKTLFLLLVMNEEELLKTIRSRTQLIKINKYKDSEVQEALQLFKKLPADEASKIAYLADGNFNIAQRMLNYDESTSLKAPFRDWMLLCLRFEASKLMEWIDQMSRVGREQQKTFFKYGLQIFRECLMMNFGDPSLIKLYGEELEFVKKFSRFVNGANADKFVDELNKASYHIERNANPKILLLNLSFKMNELLNMKAL